MTAVRVPKRAIAAIGMASFLGFMAFMWPFVVTPGSIGSTQTPPLMFGVLLLIVLAVIFAEIADGRIDAKALAMLGVLSAINAALRPLGAGTAGIETVFFILVLAGRVFGPGFGFALGCTSLFASALLTGGVGPWMPYQMFGCAWVGMFAGLLPKLKGRKEIAMLAGYAAVSGYFFGFMLNLSFWPFSLDPGSSISYEPGLPALEQLQRYLVFFTVTSLGWDTGRAITTAVLVALAGPAVLSAFRRAARRASFQAKPVFVPASSNPDTAAPGQATRAASTAQAAVSTARQPSPDTAAPVQAIRPVSIAHAAARQPSLAPASPAADSGGTSADQRPPAQRKDGRDLEQREGAFSEPERDDAPPAHTSDRLQQERADDHPKAEQG